MNVFTGSCWAKTLLIFCNQKICVNYILLTTSYLVFDFDPHKKEQSIFFYLRGWHVQLKCLKQWMLQSGNFRLIFIHHLGRVKLVCTSLQMSTIAKPTVQWSTKEMVGPWNHMSVPEYVHVIKMHKAKTIPKSSQISVNLPTFLPTFLSKNFPFFPGIFLPVWKFSRLSKNLTSYILHLTNSLEIFKTVWKLSRLSGNFPDCLKIFQFFLQIFKTVQNISQTVRKSFRLSRKFSRRSGNHPDCLEFFQTVWNSSRLSGNILGCLEIFQTVWKSFWLCGYIKKNNY